MTVCFECDNDISELPFICGKCQQEFCGSCFIGEEYCSECTEEEYKKRLRYYMGMTGFRQYYRNVIKWTLHTYSLYELYYEIPVVDIVKAWSSIFKMSSKPEQEGTVGKVVWVTHQ